MPRVTTILRKGKKALEDLHLLKVLQSEIKHELSNDPYKDSETGSHGDFVMDWDSPQSQDVIMRKNYESGEEIAISALLGQEAEMKVCIKKPGLSSILQFDCKFFEESRDKFEFYIENAYYLNSTTDMGLSAYRGPVFSDLDPDLQDQLKLYLVSRGIGKSFTNFLFMHLLKKEQDQYVKWLQKLKGTVADSETEAIDGEHT